LLIALEVIGFIAKCPSHLDKNALFAQQNCHMQQISWRTSAAAEFVQRLHDVLYEPSRKLAYFGRFCAKERYGTVNPEDYPPINGRMAKALRFLGFDVRGV
jgi:hypothetical protein